MDKIKTTAILGAGAVGAYFIWGLCEKLGDNLWVIADGDRKEKLEKDGININGKNFSLNVRTPKEAHGVDLLFVATKYTSLYDSLDDIAEIADKDTVVISLMNGVNSEEIIGGRIGMKHMLYAMMKISSERTADNIRFNTETTPGLFYGEKGQSKLSERMLAVKELLDGTPIHYKMCEDIITELWDKFALNISNNLPQAILGCGIGAYADSVYAANIFKRLREEVVAVVAAKGIIISPEADNSLAKGIVSKTAHYSTLQDLEAKRHTEIDMFSGVIVQMGKELGVATPYNEFAYNIIKAMEEKNDGKFDY